MDTIDNTPISSTRVPTLSPPTPSPSEAASTGMGMSYNIPARSRIPDRAVTYISSLSDTTVVLNEVPPAVMGFDHYGRATYGTGNAILRDILLRGFSRT